MKIILTILLFIVSGNTLALDCSSEGGKDTYNHLIYLNDLGNGNYSVTFPKKMNEREFNSANLFIFSNEMTFMNDVKVKAKGDELTYSFNVKSKSNSNFSVKTIITWRNGNMKMQCPILAEKDLI